MFKARGVFAIAITLIYLFIACLDVMTLGHMTDIKISELETDKPITGNLLSKEDFSVVNRFESLWFW